jgi:ATP-dependent RNA helicase DeaD
MTVQDPVTDSPTNPFAGIPAPLCAALEKHGITQLTSVQTAVVAALGSTQTEGSASPSNSKASTNLRISSQTGSGKTVALGIALARSLLVTPPSGPDSAKPGRSSGPRALVITPTRELASQVQAELSWLFGQTPGVDVAVVTGGTDVRAERLRLRRSPTILVGTPGRLLDHIRSRAFDCSAIQEVVLDEADQMLDMGFKDELDAIVESLPAERGSHLVSATFPPAVHRLAESFQSGAVHVQGTALGKANADIEHIAYLIRPRQRQEALVNLLLQSWGERCLIFVRTRAETAELAESLAGDGFGALPFSGELAQAQRTRTLSAFKNGTINILVATDVAARGIDVPDITTVIHADIPKESEIYTHRSGRTGRAGKAGKSLIVVPLSGQARVHRMLQQARIEADWQPIPGAKKIRQAVVKTTRRDLYEKLEGAEFTDVELEYARNLLDKLPPEKTVAMLLRMAETRLPREPMDVTPTEPRAWDPSRAAPTRTASPAGHTRPTHFVRFALTWGTRQGANPSRCMSHVCRRGGITRQAVGAIDVGLDSTTVEVSREAAGEFERRCKKPDERDPNVRVSRQPDAAPHQDRPRRSTPFGGFRHSRPGEARDEGGGPPPTGPRVKRAARGRRTPPRPPEA